MPFTRVFAIKLAMLIVCLPHCLTAIVRHGRAPKLYCTKWKYSCNSFTMDKQFLKVSFTKAVLYMYICVYINTSIYTYRKKPLKKEKNSKGYQ